MDFDILIRGSTIVDGSGSPGYKGNIGIRGEKIASIGIIKGNAEVEVDGTELIACPGFIDPHSHADLALLQLPLAENLVMQGVTTFLGGNCGLSMAPLKEVIPSQFVNASKWWYKVEPDAPRPPPFLSLKEYGDLVEENLDFAVDWCTFGGFLNKVADAGISVNYAPLVGHSTLRLAVMGENFKRNSTLQEVELMKTLVHEAMQSGALGLSSFFDPSPGEYASMEEMVELASIVSKHGGIYAPHTRHIQSQWPSNNLQEYGYGIFHGPMEDVWVGRYRGYLEAIEISMRTGIPLHIAHFSNAFFIPQSHPEYLEKAVAKASLELIDNAQKEGVSLTFDVITCSSSIASQAPMIDALGRWLSIYGKEILVEKLRGEDFRDDVKKVHEMGRLKFGMVHTKADPYWMACFRVLTCRNKEYEGKTIGELARIREREPLDIVLDVLAEDPEAMWVQFMDKRNTVSSISVFIKHPSAMPCTDMGLYSGAPKPLGSLPSPIAYGLYPHYIQTFVKEKAVISLEEAVMKATSLPANRFNLTGRGILKTGAYADIVLFDLDQICMKGNFLEPVKPPEGIEYVFVNGKIVYREKAHTKDLPGKVLRKGARML